MGGDEIGVSGSGVAHAARNHIRPQRQRQKLTPPRSDAKFPADVANRSRTADSRAGRPRSSPRHRPGLATEAPPFQPLREQARALAIVPDHLQKVAPAATEEKQMAAQRIAAQHLLHLQRQRREAPAMSVCPVASHTRTPGGNAIMRASARRRCARPEQRPRSLRHAAVAALELDLDGCRASKDFPSPCRPHLLSGLRRCRFLRHVDGSECQRRGDRRLGRLSLISPLDSAWRRHANSWLASMPRCRATCDTERRDGIPLRQAGASLPRSIAAGAQAP